MADLRETLSAKFDEIDAAATPEAAAVVEAAPPEPAVEAPAAETKAERARDESGRFVKSDEVAKVTPKAAEVGKPTEKPAAEPAKAAKAPEVNPETPPATEPTPAVKAPQSWTPAAREAFAKAPPEVQREVDRREREVTRVLNETAQVRQFAQSVHQSLTPYEPIARANGMDAMTWAGNALQLVSSLYAGTPQQKAATIAKAIQMSGADPEAINQQLANPQAAPVQQQPVTDPRELVRQAIAEERAAAERETNMRVVNEFIANPPEFFEHIKDDLPDIIRLDRARGGNMTLPQAYEKAVRMNDDVQKIISQRKEAEAAKKRAEDAAKSRAAASSIRSQPSTPPPSTPQGRRAVLEAKFDELHHR